MEMIWILLALALCFAVVSAKAITSRLLGVMERHIATADQEKQRILNELKTAGSRKKVVAANKATLEARKTRLEGKRSRLTRELQELESEVSHREHLRDAVRGKLVRPTRAGGSPVAAEGDAPDPDGAAEDGTLADLS
ncbi:MAG: hypothetical protein ABIL09_25435 [Gemmatimonadota bacterium]